MSYRLSIENNEVEDVIRNSFNILGEEVEMGVEDFINEFMEKEEEDIEVEEVKVNKIMERAYEIYRAGFLSAYLLRK